MAYWQVGFTPTSSPVHHQLTKMTDWTGLKRDVEPENAETAAANDYENKRVKVNDSTSKNDSRVYKHTPQYEISYKGKIARVYVVHRRWESIDIKFDHFQHTWHFGYDATPDPCCNIYIHANTDNYRPHLCEIKVRTHRVGRLLVDRREEIVNIHHQLEYSVPTGDTAADVSDNKLLLTTVMLWPLHPVPYGIEERTSITLAGLEGRQHFQRIRDDESTDMVIRCADGERRCHRLLFSTASDPWCAMMRPHTIESQSGIVNFSGVSLDVLDPIINILYGHNVTLRVDSMAYLNRFFGFVDMYDLQFIYPPLVKYMDALECDGKAFDPPFVYRLVMASREKLKVPLGGVQMLLSADWLAECTADNLRNLVANTNAQQSFMSFLVVCKWTKLAPSDRLDYFAGLVAGLDSRAWTAIQVISCNS